MEGPGAEAEPARLFAVLLGGQPNAARLTEDHETVHVVAASPSDARKVAKVKWGGHGHAHVDGVQELSVIDGYRILLVPTNDTAPHLVDLTYDPA